MRESDQNNRKGIAQLAQLKGFTLSLSASLLLMACSKQSRPQSFVWTPTSSRPIPAVINGSQFSNKEISLSTPNEMIERSPQKIGSAEIEGAFVQKITNSNGQLIFVKSQYYPEDLSHLLPEIQKLETQKFFFVENLKKVDSDLQTAGHVFAPKVIITTGSGIPQVVYQIDFVDKNKTGIYKMIMSPVTGLISIDRASSGFEEGKGIVFPAGPKSSQLAEVVLANLTGDGSLTKTNLKVTPQIDEKAHSANLIFDYDPQDVRFDQVQSFFYVDRALGFFQSSLGVTLPFSLEVQTNFGAPEKLNAMFYYHGQIRLGTGDGVSYSNVMKDPSIVIHESCHGLIDALTRLPLGQGEGGSLNEGFADFLTTVYLNNPNLGEVAYMKGAYKRTVANDLTVSQKNGGLYHDSLILSGTFWEIRQALGDKKALNLAIKTLPRLGPNGNFQSVGPAVQYALSTGFVDADQKVITEIMKKRGWM